MNIPELFPNNIKGKRYFNEYNRIVTQIKQLGDSSITNVNESYNTLKKDIANSFIDSYPFYYKISKNAEFYLTEKVNYLRAILFLKLMGDIYPNDWQDYHKLAEAYFKNQQYELALDNYLHSVEKNPKNISGKDQVDLIKKMLNK